MHFLVHVKKKCMFYPVNESKNCAKIALFSL